MTRTNEHVFSLVTQRDMVRVPIADEAGLLHENRGPRRTSTRLRNLNRWAYLACVIRLFRWQRRNDPTDLLSRRQGSVVIEGIIPHWSHWLPTRGDKLVVIRGVLGIQNDNRTLRDSTVWADSIGMLLCL